MSDPVDREAPTPRASSSLQRAPDFAKLALSAAQAASDLIGRFTSVAGTNIKGAVEARRIRDDASKLAIEFQSWGTRSTTSEERMAKIRELHYVQRRIDKLR